MKKTLKILMAIILFVAILAIATSVRAEDLNGGEQQGGQQGGQQQGGQQDDDDDDEIPSYATLADAIAAKDAPVVVENGFYVVKDNVEITEKITVSSDMDLVLNADLTVTGGIVVNSTLSISSDKDNTGTLNGKVQVNSTGDLVVSGEGTVTFTSVANNGTLYASSAPTGYTGTGIMYTTSESVSVTDYTNLTLKNKKTDNDIEYTNILVPTEGLENKISFAITSIVPKAEVDGAEKLEVGDYEVTVVAYYNNSIELNGVTLDDELATRNEKANCTVDGDVISIDEETEEGTVVKIAATLEGVTKDLTVGTVGATIKLDTPVQPTNPDDTNTENPGDTTEDPDNTTTEPGDDDTTTEPGDDELDNTPTTGDHIIPATAVLAVVVVANVVYFAKMKRN